MWAALGQVLPIAVAAALSSVPILVVISILLSPHRRRSGPAFLTGWVIGIALAVLLCTALAYAIHDAPPRRSQVGIGVSLIVIGLALIVFAIVVERRGGTADAARTPRWLRAAESIRPLPALGLGAALGFRPKGLLLSAAAGLSLRGEALPPGEFIIVLAVYTVLSASTVAVPVVAALVRPDSTQERLVRTRDWVTKNNRIVGVLIIMLIGVVIVGNGLTHL